VSSTGGHFLPGLQSGSLLPVKDAIHQKVPSSLMRKQIISNADRKLLHDLPNLAAWEFPLYQMLQAVGCLTQLLSPNL